MLYGIEDNKGPMSSEWFYSENNPFKKANELHQECKWEEAEQEYESLLEDDVGTSNDQNNARLNLAACMMAQGKPSKHWACFDQLLDIPEEQQISSEGIKSAKKIAQKKSILVRTDKVGIGDIFHFIKVSRELKERTDWDVVLSVPHFLKGALSGVEEKYDLKMIGVRDEQPRTDYTTHIISLLGHLKMKPSEISPEDDLFSIPERAINVVGEQIRPILAEGKTIVVLFLGENRQATLIGGKQLPHDPTKHGRHLDVQPFRVLLKQHPNLVLMDCDGKNSRFNVDGDQKNQYIKIAPEEQSFDTIQALALLMNVNEKIIAFGADNGPTNVFVRTLNKAAQRRMGLIIPNGGKENGEYDMRMEGQGLTYTQIISKCRVYKCKTPQNQTEVIERAYNDMTTQ